MEKKEKELPGQKVKQLLVRSRAMTQKELAAFHLLLGGSLGRLDFDSVACLQVASILAGHGNLAGVDCVNGALDFGGEANGGSAKQEGQGQGGNDSFLAHLSTPFYRTALIICPLTDG